MMLRLLVLTLAVGFTSAMSQPSNAQGDAGLFGPVNSDTFLPSIAQPNPWYGAVQVSVRFGNEPGQSKIMQGPNARDFWEKVKTFFNLSSDVQSYVVVVEPSINGVKLPPLPVLSIKREDSGGTKLTIERALTSLSPNVPIDGGSSFNYKISYKGVRTSEVSVFQESGKLATTLAAVPGWALSAALVPVVDKITAGLDKGMTNLRNFDLSNSATDQINIFGGMRQYVEWNISDLAGGSIATVRIELKTRRTLREPPLSIENNAELPKMDTTLLGTPAYQILRPGPSYASVRTVLSDKPTLHKTLRDASTVDSWITGCTELFANVQDVGFNITDAMVITVRLLQAESPLPSRKDLQVALWSRCFSSQSHRDLAKKIGLDDYLGVSDGPAKPPSEPRALSFVTLPDVADYVLGAGKDPAKKSLTQSVLSEGLLWNGEVMGRQDALTKLASFSGWTKYHCVTEAYPKREGDSKRHGVTVFFWNGSNPDVVLALYGPKDREPGEPAQLIEIRAPTNDEFVDCERYEKKVRPHAPLLPRRDVVTASQ